MANRPRVIYIGVATKIRLKGFKNKDTGGLITGATDGTVKLYDTTVSPPTLIATLTLVESGSSGTYSVNVPYNQSGLVDGADGRFVIFISGGAGQELTITGRCNYRNLTDDGK